LGRVREVSLGGYGHQEVAFEKLVEELAPAREMSHSPVFQVMMVLQNAPRAELQLPGLKLSSTETSNHTAKFDLTLLLEEEGDGIRGEFEYNADLFDEATIQRMAGHLRTLLEGIAQDADRSIAELPLMTQPEMAQLLIQWNETQVDDTHQCSHEMFEAQVERTPEAIALVFADEQLTYRELNERANQLAHYLQGMGVRAETLIGIMMERSIEMVVSLLAVIKAGGA
jgi:non-ribosomal peptide synthetase component F